LEKAQQELSFDENTLLNVEEAYLRKLLATSDKKFITIGRFSKEKGHFRLIEAYEKIYEENPNTCLIILGGYGDLYDATVRKAAASKASARIVVIYYMSNPFPLLKQCDYFVLPSFYEGFGLVLAEADMLGVRCISTRIVGPSMFMEQYGGYLMENSKEGIIQGMRDCLAGKVPERLKVDYDQYNQEAVEQFESLIS
jgi:CDP-glycerol glycerophosphotransferase